MDKKMQAIIGIVVIVVVIAAAFVILNNGNKSNDNGGDDPIDDGATQWPSRVLVYGNANNDDYLNMNDVYFIKDLISKGNWDSEAYPYADANCDGKLNEDDVTYLQDLLAGKSMKMYYTNVYGDTSYFNYPLGDRQICVTRNYGFMMCELLGIYDHITGGTTTAIGLSESRYPGCSSLTNLGAWNSSDLSSLTENFLASDCSVIIGHLSKDLYEKVHASGKIADHILLYANTQVYDNIDIVTSMMTLGVLFDRGQEARAYAAYWDNMNSMIQDRVKDLQKYTDIICYEPNATETGIDTLGETPGAYYGDVWNIMHLPLEDIADHDKDGYYKTEIENVLKKNPDVIFICMTSGRTDYTPEQAQALFEEYAAHFKESDAYKNKMIFGFNYETMGTYIGVSALGLLASYVWPGSFDEGDGWNMLQEAYDTFTVLDIDVRQAGGLQVFKLN